MSSLQCALFPYKNIVFLSRLFYSQPEILLPALVKSSHEAIKDGTQSLILGCTGMTGLAQNLEKALRADGIKIPVIDPSLAAIMQLYSLIKQSLVQSPSAYYRDVQ